MRVVSSFNFVLLLAFFMAACSGNMHMSEDAKQKLFTTPDQALSPTVPEAVTAATAPPEYLIYRLTKHTFGFNREKGSLSATITIESTAGTEDVNLVGALRADGSASLFDVTPLATGQNRLVGEAYCADMGVCSQIILNVYYNVGGKTLHTQFESDAMVAAAKAAAAKPPAPAVEAGGESDGASEWHPTERALPDETKSEDEKPGEYVGAPRNEVLIGQLWPRSKTPELPPLLSRAEDPTTQAVVPVVKKPVRPDSRTMPRPSQRPPPVDLHKTAQPDVKPVAKPVTPVKPIVRAPVKPAPTRSPETQSRVGRWLQGVRDWLVPPLKMNSAPPTLPRHKRVAPPSRPAGPQGNPSKATPVVVPIQRQAGKPDPVAPTGPTREQKGAGAEPSILGAPPIVIQPGQAIVPPPVAVVPSPVRTQVDRGAQPTMSYPFPPAKSTIASDDLDQKIALLEARLAPLLNVRDGGQAQGSYGYSEYPASSLKHASQLKAGPGLKLISITGSAHFGSGLLVSFLENAGAYFFKMFDITIYVGDMSLKKGGAYGNGSSHNTHRDGLDADIAWIKYKRPLQDSALDSRGEVNSDFNFEQTWSFLKLAYRQELVEDAQKTTAVSRVFMSPRVKDGFCSWAKKQNLLQESDASELMRLIRREKGHHKHFHLSLKCSPHYPLCRNLAGPPPPGPGCE